MNFGNNQGFNPGDFGQGLGDDQNQQQQYQYGQQQQQQQYQQFQGQNPMYQQQQMMPPQGGYMPQGGMMAPPGMFPHMQGGNMGGLGPQMSMPGQYQQPMNMGGFPPMQDPAQPRQEEAKAAPTGGMSLGTSSFNMDAAKEFIPAGVMVKTESEFPDLGDAFAEEAPKKKGKGKKGKGGAKAVVVVKKVEEEVDLTTAWKGKPSTFFVMKELASPPQVMDPNNPMNQEMNDDQWDFIFQYYPEYAQAPYSMMSWIFGQALQNEETQDRLNGVYGKPTNGAQLAGEESDEEPEQSSNKMDRAFNQGKKQMNKAQQKRAEEEKKKAQQERVNAEAKKLGITEESKMEKEKAKEMAKFKDVKVNMNPDGLTEIDTTREPASLVFIGHVDAGKSTISGQIMYKMGVIDERTIQKFKDEAKSKGRDSWWLAYVMDVSDDEKAKGKTVEVGRAQFDTKKKKYTLFDAPGHKNYVPQMIMGASMADFGGLVISARKGEFEAGFQQDGQTREHAQLAKSLGIQKLIVIVNKMDDARWSKERYDEIYAGLQPFLNKTGYKDSDLIWVPIAGLTGQNLDTRVDPKECPWYKGPTLWEALDTIETEKRDPNGELRIPIIDKLKDGGTVVYGKVESGTVRIGDKLVIAPNGHLAQVLTIFDAKENIVASAGPGENIKVKVNVADEEQIQKGYVFCSRDKMMPATDLIQCEVDILEIPESKKLMTKGYACMMHIHSWNDEVLIKDIMKSIEPQDKGEDIIKLKPKFAKSHTKMHCTISTQRGLVALEKFEDIQQMGRFTLRDEGKTIGLGKVLKYKPHKKGDPLKEAPKSEQKTAAQIKDAGGPKQDLVFNMETGETEAAKPKLDAIAEEY